MKGPLEQQAGLKRAHRFTVMLLVVYVLVILWIMLFKLGVRFSYMDQRTVNLRPFRGLYTAGERLVWSELILNVLVFIPLGLYVGALYRHWKFRNRLLLILGASLLLEGLQFMMAIGAFDITDVITNTTGGMTGLIGFMLLDKIFRDPLRAQRVVNVIAAMGTILVVVLLAMLKLNMLPIRYQ